LAPTGRQSADPPAEAGAESSPEFSPEERRQLLALARQAIALAFEERSPSTENLSEHLRAPRGVFTTLMLGGVLRGCVGNAAPVEPLAQAVVSTAIGAAFRDPRFQPLALEELPQLHISLNILSPLFPIQPEQVELGKHGLLVSQGDRRALLLPEVPLHMGWDREKFLEQTCLKAGLAPDAWRKGATLEAFTTEAFAEKE
jgi:AmmeMemoRadiSam system protein A